MIKTLSSELTIPIQKNNTFINAILTIPKDCTSIIIFAHGSGSGRFSSRNQYVAKRLVDAGFASLLLDLLTNEEEAIDNLTRELRFDISFLADRLIEVTNWLNQNPQTKTLEPAFFGSSTGAAAALIAAAKLGRKISAIVSRGGRPDLAGSFLKEVHSPIMLIVGGNDFGVIELNQQAYNLLSAPKTLQIIPGATHLFEEPGALEEVVSLAIAWFKKYT